MHFSSHKEKRKYARVALQSIIKAQVVEGNDPSGEQFEGVGKNIGVEGMLLTSEKKLSPGKMLHIDIIFPGETDPVSIRGQIRWCASLSEGINNGGPYDMGVQFIDITRNHLRLLVKNVCGSLSEETLASFAA